MAPKGWCLRPGRSRRVPIRRAAWILAFACTLALFGRPAWAGALTGKASLSINAPLLGQPFVLTITLSGDLAQRRGDPAFRLPDGFHLNSRRQVTELALGTGGVSRTLSFVYVLTPTEPGIFQLGPFAIEQQRQPLLVDPVTVAVKKPRLPPFLAPQPRYTL